MLNSQRTKSGTLQGTQSRHTKANLAKEPALCQHTGNTRFGIIGA